MSTCTTKKAQDRGHQTVHILNLPLLECAILQSCLTHLGEFIYKMDVTAARLSWTSLDWGLSCPPSPLAVMWGLAPGKQCMLLSGHIFSSKISPYSFFPHNCISQLSLCNKSPPNSGASKSWGQPGFKPEEVVSCCWWGRVGKNQDHFCSWPQLWGPCVEEGGATSLPCWCIWVLCARRVWVICPGIPGVSWFLQCEGELLAHKSFHQTEQGSSGKLLEQCPAYAQDMVTTWLFVLFLLFILLVLLLETYDKQAPNRALIMCLEGHVVLESTPGRVYVRCLINAPEPALSLLLQAQRASASDLSPKMPGALSFSHYKPKTLPLTLLLTQRRLQQQTGGEVRPLLVRIRKMLGQ